MRAARNTMAADKLSIILLAGHAARTRRQPPTQFLLPFYRRARHATPRSLPLDERMMRRATPTLPKMTFYSRKMISRHARFAAFSLGTTFFVEGCRLLYSQRKRAAEATASVSTMIGRFVFKSIRRFFIRPGAVDMPRAIRSASMAA